MRRPESGEQEAALREHGRAVWRLVVRLLGNASHDAADCFQQTFVEFASRQTGWNDIREVGSLLRRIATVRAIDVVRRRIRERARSQELDATLIASRREPKPSARAETDELLDALRVALAELPDSQSAAFVLTQIEEIPHDEAARAIGVSVNHLGVLLHRARARLRERLESHQPV